ncbi:hypothetical protein ABPG75_009027 [Micractinium tetrahymenae]
MLPRQTASWRGVRPLLSPAASGAPAPANSCTTCAVLMCFCRLTARCMAVLPLLSAALTFAPACSSRLTASTCPFCATHMSGVDPSPAVALTFAPAESSTCITGTLPKQATTISIVSLLALSASTSAPACSSTSRPTARKTADPLSCMIPRNEKMELEMWNDCNGMKEELLSYMHDFASKAQSGLTKPLQQMAEAFQQVDPRNPCFIALHDACGEVLEKLHTGEQPAVVAAAAGAARRLIKEAGRVVPVCARHFPSNGLAGALSSEPRSTLYDSDVHTCLAAIVGAGYVDGLRCSGLSTAEAEAPVLAKALWPPAVLGAMEFVSPNPKKFSTRPGLSSQPDVNVDYAMGRFKTDIKMGQSSRDAAATRATNVLLNNGAGLRIFTSFKPLWEDLFDNFESYDDLGLVYMDSLAGPHAAAIMNGLLMLNQFGGDFEKMKAGLEKSYSKGLVEDLEKTFKALGPRVVLCWRCFWPRLPCQLEKWLTAEEKAALKERREARTAEATDTVRITVTAELPKLRKQLQEEAEKRKEAEEKAARLEEQLLLSQRKAGGQTPQALRSPLAAANLAGQMQALQIEQGGSEFCFGTPAQHASVENSRLPGSGGGFAHL